MFTGHASTAKGLTILALTTIVIVPFLYTGAFAISYPFCDDMEDTTTGNWGFNSPWGYDATYAHSGTLSISDSPGGTSYQNNVNILVALSSGIDLGSAQMPVLSFWHRYALESNKDYGFIDVSADGGASWTTIYFVTGFSTVWKEEKVDLSPYALLSDVRIRFRLNTDNQNRYDGWYIDDVCIQETVKPTIAYPFFDDMENGAATDSNWLSSSWELVTGGHSGLLAWHDSPEGNYTPPIYTPVHTSLTLAGIIGLTGATNPQMTFWHHYDLDQGFVEVSENYGHTWTTKRSFSSSQANWIQSQVDLSEYVGLEIRVRFRHYCYSSEDGWYIDDVLIKDAPPDVELKPLTNVTMHGADLCWTRYTDSAFLGYKIYRDYYPGVDRGDVLVASISDIDDTCYSDTYSILEPSFYSYKVYVIDTTGMYSLGSNEELAFYTIPYVSYPFCDSMENGTDNWEWGSPWGLTTQYAHSGTLSWTDSPGTAYQNNINTALETRINLTSGSAQMPVLSFWHRYALESNKDYGFIDVSADGGASWTTIYFVTGFSTVWKEEKVDLSPYALLSDVRIRFRLNTDNQNRYDGWYIDDVCIQETVKPTIAYPFFDDMENGAATDSNWLSSSWELVTGGHSGLLAWHDSPEGNYTPPIYTPVHTSLTLAGIIGLTGATNPQMTFWHHYDLDQGFVEVSENYGHTWTTKRSFSSSQANWIQSQVDLSEYVGLEIRVRFRHYCYSSEDGWYIDDVLIKDAPPDVELKPLTNVTMHGADLCWTRYTDSAFLGYKIYRDYYPGVDRGDVLVASISDIDDTCYSDTYSILEPSFYSYKVYVIDTTGMYSLGSNEELAFYTIPYVSYPFCDSMENGTDNWEWGSPWGLTTQYAHSGTLSWTDSPGTAYQNNINTALETRINLTSGSAQMPVLSFWHRYALESNKDYGFIDVSADGGASWTTIYFVTGFSTVWKEEKVDLSPYALLSDVRIRFRLNTDNQNRYDGWYIDDVCIQETVKPTIAYPFFDDMENGAATDSNWISSSWELIDWDDCSPTHCWHDSPEGYYTPPAYTPVHTSLTLAGIIDLTGAANPQMSFCHHYDLDQGFVEVSENYGHTWTTKRSFSSSQANWIQSQVDLSEYVGLEIRVRFRHYCYSSEDGWYIDDVSISHTFIAVTSPNGGESWCVDSTDSITWNSSGIGSVMIEYTTDGGTGWDTVTSGTPAVPGTYPWTIPNTPSANCLVRICDTGGGLCDTSDNAFTIDTCDGVCEDPVHFVFTDSTGDSYSIVIDSAFLDGIELQECDEIGVFDDTGGGKGLLCVGASVYHPDDLPIPLTAWKDDPQTDVKDGYTPGHIMYFKVWSRSQDREEDALGHYSVGDGRFESGVFSQLWLEAPLPCEDLTLSSGWQWVSTSIDPDPSEIESLFADCWGDLDIMVACDGSFCIPGVGCWIDGWNVVEMYKVHMAATCGIEFCGPRVPTDTLIPLNVGWNCIAYLPKCPLEPEYALASIWGNLNIVKNDDGEFCIPGVGCWIDCMEYNEGYKANLSTADVLAYPIDCPPCPPPFAKANSHGVFVKATHFSYSGNTGESYSVVVNSIDLDGNHPEVGDEVGVFTSSGLCVGAGVWQGELLGIAAWQDDDRTEAKDGFALGENVVFKLWNKSENKEVELSASFERGDGRFGTDAYALVGLKGVAEGVSSHLPTEFQLAQNYPNPFNPETKVFYALPKDCHVKLTIYNLLGQRVRVLVDEHQTAGARNVYWNGKDDNGNGVATGIYFYRMKAGDFTETKRMILMK